MLQERLELPDSDPTEVNSYFLEQGWTDGLPIIPPTEPAVERMLSLTDRSLDDVIGVMFPNAADATIHAIAVNAVMAGCRPEYFPVVVAAIEAITDEKYNLFGVQATTNPATPFLVVNGPLAQELGFNSKGNCFGPGAQANATVGRAVRLCMISIGGGLSQLLDKATLGQPGKYGMCIAENEDESPWEPHHVERGFGTETSTVSVFTVTGTQNIFEMAAQTAAGLLKNLASSCAYVGMHNVQFGGGPVLVFCPEHAALLASGGFTKQDVKRILYETARVRVEDFPEETLRSVVRVRRPKWFWSDIPSAGIPLADTPDDITILVAGGPGTHSIMLPRSSIGGDSRIIKPITQKNGAPIRSIS